ncbi:hypothetical protein [Nocardia sp. NBC_01730]|uniref:hypothetical protein n=1 Tax=Nocardia sp. NBC_01730 TaxID=2975998 RepID=UPI002E150445
MGVKAVRDLRSIRPAASAEELERFETDVLAEFVLARSAAGLADATIRGDLSNLEQMRTWFGRPLWEMARQLLTDPHTTSPPGSTPTRAHTHPDTAGEHSGSP